MLNMPFTRYFPILTLLFISVLVSCYEDGLSDDSNTNRDGSINGPADGVILLEEGLSSGIASFEDQYFVINSDVEFDDFWSQHKSGSSNEPPPVVDFNTKSVIGLIMAQQPSGGYAIKLGSYAVSNTGATAYIERTAPGKSCMVIQILTIPFYIAVVDKVANVEFSVSEIVEECGPPVKNDYEIVDSGNRSAVLSQEFIVVQDQLQFEYVWRRHIGENGDAVAPTVDFEKSTLIIQFLGGSVSCGRRIAGLDFKEFSNAIEIIFNIEVSEQEIQCLVAEQPYIMFTVAKTQTLISSIFHITQVSNK